MWIWPHRPSGDTARPSRQGPTLDMSWSCFKPSCPAGLFCRCVPRGLAASVGPTVRAFLGLCGVPCRRLRKPSGPGPAQRRTCSHVATPRRQQGRQGPRLLLLLQLLRQT